MVIAKMINIELSLSELKDAILLYLEGNLNDEVCGSDEWRRKNKIISHLKNNIGDIEWHGGRFVVSIDGIAEREIF